MLHDCRAHGAFTANSSAALTRYRDRGSMPEVTSAASCPVLVSRTVPVAVFYKLLYSISNIPSQGMEIRGRTAICCPTQGSMCMRLPQ